MENDGYFSLNRRPLEWYEPGPGDQNDLLGYNPNEKPDIQASFASGLVDATYETVFSLGKVPLEAPESMSEGGAPELPDSEYIGAELQYANSHHEDVFALQRTPLDTPVAGEKKNTPELATEEYMDAEMFSDNDAYRAVFSLPRIPLAISENPSQKLELAPLLGKPSALISEAEKGLMKRTRQRNIAEIACVLEKTGHFRRIDKRLYLFRSPCWTVVDNEDVEDYLREEVSIIFPEIVDYLSSANLEEINRQLRGRLYRESRFDLERHNQQYLCCVDGLYRISDGAVLPPDPGLNLFSYLNVSASEIGFGDGYYTELFLDNATDGNSALRDRLLEMVAAVLTAIPLKKFFFLE